MMTASSKLASYKASITRIFSKRPIQDYCAINDLLNAAQLDPNLDETDVEVLQTIIDRKLAVKPKATKKRRTKKRSKKSTR